MTPQNYYARRTARCRQAVDLGLVLALVRAERAQQSRLGVRKLYYLIEPELRAAGVKLGRDRLFAGLRKVGLLVAPKPSEWPKTTHFNANLPVFKNLIRHRQLTGPNRSGWPILPISAPRKAFCIGPAHQQVVAQIVGFHLGETLETADSLKALSMALRSLKGAERPIHHSDRGCQSASHAYIHRVKAAGLQMSMTETNHSAENAVAERVNGILKQEYWLDANFANRLEARQATHGGIHLYNHRRPHTALGMATPQEVHSGTRKP